MRTNSKRPLASLLLVLLVAVVLASLGIVLAAAAETLDALLRGTRFHGIAVDRADPARLYLATHQGLYVVDGEGRVSRLSERTDDFMGFSPHPSDPAVLFASGHPLAGGNLGVIISRDRGRSWQRLSDSARGPVDFHQMDVSRADPSVIYGVYRGLQKSTDGGRTWTLAAPAPEGLIDLAAGSRPGSYSPRRSGGSCAVRMTAGLGIRFIRRVTRPPWCTSTRMAGCTPSSSASGSYGQKRMDWTGI